MIFRPKCPECGDFSKSFLSTALDLQSQVICKKGHAIGLNYKDFLTSKFIWQSCPLCNSLDAFVCKVVPRKLLMIVLIPTLMVAFFALAWNWWIGVAILVTSAVVDALLFNLLPNMLVCYGCESEFRSITKENETHFKPFDHHVAEKHRQRK